MGATGQGSPSPPVERARARLRRSLRGPGWLLLLLAIVTAAAAVHTANNRLYLVLGGMLAMLCLELLLGAWNLRNITATRKLPPEVFANRSARGSIVLGNPRRLLPAASLQVGEQGHPAHSRAAWLGPGEQLAVPVTWRFTARGRTQLAALEIRSHFPFGLVEHCCLVPRPVPVLVYPHAIGQPGRDAQRTIGSHNRDDDLHDPRATGAGDFLDLREYQPGDPTRLIHWPTTARMGRAMIVIRGSDSDEEVLVELEEQAEPHRWERSISEACGQVLHHVRLGRAVGLRVGRRTWPPRRGAPQHRSLLTALALLPHGHDEDPGP